REPPPERNRIERDPAVEAVESYAIEGSRFPLVLLTNPTRRVADAQPVSPAIAQELRSDAAQKAPHPVDAPLIVRNREVGASGERIMRGHARVLRNALRSSGRDRADAHREQAPPFFAETGGQLSPRGAIVECNGSLGNDLSFIDGFVHPMHAHACFPIVVTEHPEDGIGSAMTR